MVEFILTPTPWGIDQPEAVNISPKPQVSQAEDPILVSGIGDPHLFVPLERGCPYGGSRRVQLPPASFPFLWGGQELQAYRLPTNHRPHSGRVSLLTSIECGSHSFVLCQDGTVGRPSHEHTAPLSVQLSDWINWQIACFSELAHMGVNVSALEEAIRRGPIRRKWKTAISVWVHDRQDEPRMDLIIKLAADRVLGKSLSSISRSPRKILERVREQTRLQHIQQLDAACIRDYARRPGVTVAEKAGPRQQLLAVQRRETSETLENRLTCWVLEELSDLANEYCVTNARFPTHTRVTHVRNFGRSATEWRQSPMLEAIGTDSLVHPASPNYSLQFNQRYNVIYRAYLLIRQKQRVLDDAWEWQRVLWGETGRQLLFSALLQHAGWRDRFSMPYYLPEGAIGHWTASPVAPGPFQTPSGECIVFDARDVTDRKKWCEKPPFPGAKFIGATGCSQILLWPEKNTGILVWFVYWTGTRDDIPALMKQCGETMRRVVSDIQRYEKTALRLKGLLLFSDINRPPECTGVDLALWPIRGTPELVSLLVPADVHRVAHDLNAGIQTVLDL